MKKISIIALVACAVIAAVSCNNQPKNSETSTEEAVEVVEAADTTKCCADSTACTGCCADSTATEAAQ